jgi:hypothetical protein
MTRPMLPRIIHITTADIEEEEEGSKASLVPLLRRASFDSTCELKKDPNQ